MKTDTYDTYELCMGIYGKIQNIGFASDQFNVFSKSEETATRVESTYEPVAQSSVAFHAIWTQTCISTLF